MSDISLKSRSTRTLLGSLADVQSRSEKCPFCFLVIQSTLPVDNIRTYDSAKCYINWELDGRAFSHDHDGTADGRTRRIHIVWDDKRLKDSYLVFVAPERYLRPNSDARPVWGNEALFLGRTIDTEMGNQALIKSWLDLCRKTHQGPCRDDTTMESSLEFGDVISQSYFGVIDVLDMQLTSLPFKTNMAYSDMVVPHQHENGYESVPIQQVRESRPFLRRTTHEPYIALSYVWGEGKPYMTKLSNIMLHRNHGGLERNLEDLPRVFHDAFNLVRCLGVRYLWIDSLCIVQDSSRSWGLNSRVMDLIYGNAVLTICAADGVDSSTPLKAMHPKAHDARQISLDCAPRVRLMVSRPPEIGIRASKWNTRAWTFQERLLSKRCLIFTEGRVYFQCLSTGMSEDIFADREGAGWSLDLVNAPLQMLRELNRRALWVYTNCVALYTARVLTKRKDILAAFNGISNLMEKTMQAPFIFGLPSSHFDMALLWEPQSAIERRVPKTEDEKAEFGGMQFPSWSWCGWTSDALDSPMENNSAYKAVMVDGCVPNVREWLMKHTWIHWYIRDGHGDLRPLWHREKSREDKSSEKRWRGYRARPECPDIHGRGRDRHRDCRCEVRDGRGASGERRGVSGEYRDTSVEREREIRALIRERERLRRINRESRGVSGQRWGTDREYRGASGERRGVSGERQVVIGEWPDANGGYRGASGERTVIRGRENDDQRKPDDRDGMLDDYGRPITKDFTDIKVKRFSSILPENPYRVVMADYSSKPDQEFPDQPILQFWTWRTSLHLVPSENPAPKPGKGLCRYDIADETGDWCGSMVLDEKWAARSQRSKHDFIAISHAKAFTQDECDVWTYYIPKEREQSEWDLYYVLLVERKGGMRWERVALGKVFRAAFADAEWKEIVLG